MIAHKATAIILVSSLLLSGVLGAAIQKRDVNGEENAPTTTNICHARTPCAWAVYVPFTRKIEYYMTNTCECAKGKQCVRENDDISVSAYVYRCSEGNNSTTNSRELPNNTAS
uniref:Putative conserved secreted protein n=1 Tax=Panstrongylus lignarius TaxID=156445 RepID=A0A224Y274_9HEMI